MSEIYNYWFLKDLEDSGVDLDSFIVENKLLCEKLNKKYIEVELLKSVWDYAPCTISCVGSDLKYKRVNPELLNIIGLSEEKLIGTRLGSASNDDKFSKWIMNFFEKGLDTDSIHIETCINNQNKSFYSIAKRVDDDALIIGMDITELKEMQHNSIFNEKMLSLGEMSASIIHEINNPLTSIGLNLDLLKMFVEMDSVDKEKIKKNIVQMENMHSLIMRIIKSLKNFSRRGEQISNENINLNEVVDESLLIIGGKIKKNKVKVINNIKSDVFARFNKTEMYQIITNLLNNSVDAIKNLEDRWIILDCFEKDEGKLSIEIKDSGKGIPKEIGENIFNKFYSTKKLGEGTGLGLHIVKELMIKHGGDIVLCREHDNTTFRLTMLGGSNE